MRPTWILLRGLTRGSGHWGGFDRSLQEALGEIDCIALDLPGNGVSNKLRSPLTIEAMAAYGREQVRALGIESPVHLLAVSMGAMVAVDWAARAPQTVAGCVLVNTSFARVDPWRRRLRPSSYASLLRIACGTRSSAQREAAILRLTSRNADAAASVVDEWTRLRDAYPVALANALRQLLAAARYRPPTRAPQVPLLVLCSARDALVDARCSLALAARWHADCALHPSAGHDLTLDDGPWVASRIRQWLGGEPRSWMEMK
jgi:pimeloyl-ACP methyl ester carboxylesterase